MTLVRRDNRRAAFCALLAAVICGLAISMPSGALGAGRRCSSIDLRLGIHNHHTTPAGRTSWILVFHNEDGACFLQGHPGTELLNHNGGSIFRPEAIVRRGGGPTPTLHLERRSMAYFTFSYTNGATCPGHNFDFYYAEFLLSHHLRLMLGRSSICDASAEISPYRAHA